jgi:hypothetical protein
MDFGPEFSFFFFARQPNDLVDCEISGDQVVELIGKQIQRKQVVERVIGRL